MKKSAIVSSLVFISFLLVSQGVFAQRYLRGGPGIGGDDYEFNLAQEQIEKIDKLELELEKELSPLFSKLRLNCMELEKLEAQRTPDLTKIEKIWDEIYKLEFDIRNKEILHEKKIRDLLTEDQKTSIDSYYAYRINFYGRGGFGRGHYGRGYGRYGYSAGRLGRGYYGVRYGRGPCGAGLGRWYRMEYGSSRWNWRR